MCFVYILQSSINGKFYIGSTNNIERRLLEHNSGHTKHTREQGPFNLIFQQEYPFIEMARKAEIWLKKQKSHLFLDKIIEDGKINKVFGTESSVG
jgi:putative endonuclease